MTDSRPQRQAERYPITAHHSPASPPSRQDCRSIAA